jgi:ribose transport system permease protein
MSDAPVADPSVARVPRRWTRFAGPSFGDLRDLGVLVTLAVLFIVLSLTSDAFLTQRNLLNILEQWAPIGMLALGGAVVIITGGFDLSIGAMYALAGVVSVVVTQHTDVAVGVLAGVATGTACGLINGVLGTFGRMNVFVATLGSSIVFAGLATRISDGSIQAVDDSAFGFANDKLLGIAVSIWMFIAAIAVCSIYLRRTSYGRRTYAIGGNAEAARLAGVRVFSVRICAFVIAGLGAGLGAVIVASQSLSADGSRFTGVKFDAWTAMLIGGNSLAGGEGAVWRTVVGVLILALVNNGFNLLGVDPLWQQVLTGLILLGALGLDALVRRKRS